VATQNIPPEVTHALSDKWYKGVSQAAIKRNPRAAIDMTPRISES
jgi:hypothetical protein